MSASGALSLVAIGLLTATPAMAQVSRLDPSQLIDGLGKQGMSELLIHLADTEKFDDPVVNVQIRIAQERIRFRTLLDKVRTQGASLSPEERQQVINDATTAINNALTDFRKMVKDFHDRPRRPVWQTDMAEMVFLEYLPAAHQLAAMFYEFGVTDHEQATAFRDTAIDALEQLESANIGFFNFQGKLSQKDFAERFDDVEVKRLIDEYWRVKTQFFLATAAYAVALLPDNDPYWTKPAELESPDKKTNARDERARLLALVTKNPDIEKIATDANAGNDVKVPMLSLIGRALLLEGKPQQAMESLESATGAASITLEDLKAQMGKARAFLAMDRFNESIELARSLYQHTTVANDSLMNLLVTDFVHRLLLTHAQALPEDQRAQATAEAYQPYLDLIEKSPDLKGFIYKRWKENLPPGADLTKLPPIVPMAVGDLECTDGRNLMVEAINLAQGGADEATINAKRDEALPHIQRAIEVNEKLIARPDCPEGVKATAMFNLGVATYFLDVTNPTYTVQAAKVLTQLADSLPAQKKSEDAIKYAEALLRPLNEMSPPPQGVAEQYQATAKVMFDKFSSSSVADDARLYYAAKILEPTGRYAEAAAVLEKLPFSHPFYWEARRFRLDCLYQAFKHTDAADAPEALRVAKEEAAKVVADADAALQGAGADQTQRVMDARGSAQLVQVDIAIDEGEFKTAQDLLKDFDTTYNDPALVQLVRQAQEKRIRVFIASGQIDEAVKVADRLMKQAPDVAVNVMNLLVDRLFEEVEDNRRKALVELRPAVKDKLLKDAAARTGACVKLATLLRDWSLTRPDMQEGERLAYELLYTKALTLDGQADLALAALKPLVEKFPNDPDIMTQTAEAYFAKGDADSLLKGAGPLFNKLITGLQNDTPKSPLYWNAWMRWFQICEKLNQNTQDISFRVQQLKSVVDPNLGGEPYKSELERLALRYAK